MWEQKAHRDTVASTILSNTSIAIEMARAAAQPAQAPSRPASPPVDEFDEVRC